MSTTLPLSDPSSRTVERWAWSTLVANAVIILTGGLVRLTGSGLGCPTWPRCTTESFVPHSELGVHGVIEFSNRMLTYVLIAVVVAAFVAVWRWASSTRSLRWHAGLIAAGVPLQGVIGGISVLTQLNPWVVALHLVLSMALVAASMWLVLRVRAVGAPRTAAPTTSASVRRLVVATYAVSWVVVWLGTVVTGSGPHAGDVNAPRNDLSPQTMSHVHAASVYLLIALTVALCVAVRSGAVARSARVLLVVELAQGVIGFVQYFTGLPIAVVALHLAGAAVLVAAATALLVVTLSPRTAADAGRAGARREPAAV
ncbi:MAG: COX15/CtaA family protein [Actinomycetota bacterium]|nr:COX15/CtaA family protein [Actinomycetota bacterium]